MTEEFTESTAALPEARTPVNLWRAAAVGLLLVLVLAAAASASMYEQFTAQVRYLQQQLKSTPQIKYIAVLLDDKYVPAMLVTLDPQDSALEIQRLTGLREGREDSMQLWSLQPGAQPVSLGVLQSAATTLRLPVAEALLSGGGRLAVSVENKGGALVSHGPRLPFLLSGEVLQKAR